MIWSLNAMLKLYIAIRCLNAILRNAHSELICLDCVSGNLDIQSCKKLNKEESRDINCKPNGSLKWERKRFIQFLLSGLVNLSKMHNVRPLPNVSCRQDIDRDFCTILQNDYDDHENIVVKIANRMYIVVKLYSQL